MIREFDRTVSISGQLRTTDLAALARAGFTHLVNNRPDGEEADQPLASEIEQAAADAGIAYRFIPIARGIGPAEVDQMQEALREAASGRMLAFCRSGARSALAVALARRAEGVTGEEVTSRLHAAGFDHSPIAHLL